MLRTFLRALALVLGLTGLTAATSPPAHALADGDWIDCGGAIYRIAGGAPIYVSNWANVGGSAGKTVQTPTAAQCTSLLARFPADGTVIHGWASGRAFVVAGGAPIRISNFAHVPGHARSIAVDDVAINAAGNGDPRIRLRGQPANGTILWAPHGWSNPPSTPYFRVTRGRPFPWTHHLSANTGVQVDGWAVATCETAPDSTPHLDCSPTGNVDHVSVDQSRRLRIAGWAADPSGAGPYELRLHVGSPADTRVFHTHVERLDVVRHLESAGTFGFDRTFEVPAGSYDICLYAINTGHGTNTTLHCQRLSVAATAPDRLAKPTARARDNGARVTWVPRYDGGSAVAEYEVQLSTGKIVSAPGNTTTKLVKGLQDGKRYRFRVRAVNGVGAGAWSPWSDRVRVR